jgi:xanthine dehydrogenase YagR molybdenum-binding subunit
MRGPGETLGVFAVESAMDELAYALKIDPLELRLRNYAQVDPETGYPWSSKALRACYQEGAERFGWEKRTLQPGSMRSDDALIGWGMATAAYDVRLVPASASARMSTDNTVLIQSATCDQGTGSYTIMRQIAADALGMPMESVTFELGDTHMPLAPVSAGSFTAASVGTAVQMAASSLRHRLLQLALTDVRSPLYGLTKEQIAISDAYCFVKDHPEQGEMYADILKRRGLPHVEATERVQPVAQESERQTQYMFGVHFAEVRIHPLLRTVRVSRYVARFGAGRILNPQMAHSQLVGGIIWGIGMALMEHTVLDPQNGQIVNNDLAAYHLPVNADIPEIDADFVEENDSHINPLGAKGLGEIGTIGAAAAIANAVYHATGERIRALPITLDKLL